MVPDRTARPLSVPRQGIDRDRGGVIRLCRGRCGGAERKWIDLSGGTGNSRTLNTSKHVCLSAAFQILKLRTMLDRALELVPGSRAGRWLVQTRHANRPWVVVVEPDPDERLLYVVTVHPQDKP